jgi:hypothetical protein
MVPVYPNCRSSSIVATRRLFFWFMPPPRSTNDIQQQQRCIGINKKSIFDLGSKACCIIYLLSTKVVISDCFCDPWTCQSCICHVVIVLLLLEGDTRVRFFGRLEFLSYCRCRSCCCRRRCCQCCCCCIYAVTKMAGMPARRSSFSIAFRYTYYTYISFHVWKGRSRL